MSNYSLSNVNLIFMFKNIEVRGMQNVDKIRGIGGYWELCFYIFLQIDIIYLFFQEFIVEMFFFKFIVMKDLIIFYVKSIVFF